MIRVYVFNDVSVINDRCMGMGEQVDSAEDMVRAAAFLPCESWLCDIGQ